MIIRVFTFFILIALIDAIPIPNGLIGKLEVECGKDEIEVLFSTEDIFLGRVFVVGHANETDCVSRNTGRTSTSITIPKDKCGVVTIRSNNPPGLFLNVKVMISFHDEFITKIDRGYEISCFYMESEKTVTFPISVAPNTLQPFTEIAEMPQCRYEVVDPVTQLPVSVVSVGNKLLHKWICKSEAPNLWCMIVHTCFVEDGSGTEFVILNDDGCAIDRYLLDNLEYGPGALQAQKEAHAFKFADKVVVNFQCSIRLDIKDGECPIPNCPDLSKQRPRINKRATGNASIFNVNTHKNTVMKGYTEVDVRSPKIDVLDPQIGFGAGLEDTIPKSFVSLDRQDFIQVNKGCIPIESLGVLLGGIGALVISLIGALAYILTHSRH